MHTAELLEEAIALAGRLGYRVRMEWLEVTGGGCEFSGQKWIFVDLSLTVFEQFDQVIDAIRNDPAIHAAGFSRELRARLGLRRSA